MDDASRLHKYEWQEKRKLPCLIGSRRAFSLYPNLRPLLAAVGEGLR